MLVWDSGEEYKEGDKEGVGVAGEIDQKFEWKSLTIILVIRQ